MTCLVQVLSFIEKQKLVWKGLKSTKSIKVFFFWVRKHQLTRLSLSPVKHWFKLFCQMLINLIKYYHYLTTKVYCHTQTQLIFPDHLISISDDQLDPHSVIICSIHYSFIIFTIHSLCIYYIHYNHSLYIHYIHYILYI